MGETGSSRDRKVLVAGATGYLGGYVVRALAGAGYRVRALARDPARLGELADLSEDVFEGHATRPETLEGLCDGVDVVFSSVGVRSFHRKPTVWEVDYRANMNLLERARESGVGHFVFVSAVKGRRLAKRGVEVAVAREAVVDALKQQDDMRWTVLRPTGFFNDMEELFGMARSGRGWVIAGGKTPLNPIHGADLADEVVRAVEEEGYWNASVARGGPDVLTHRQIVELAFESLGREPRIRSVPGWLLTPIRWFLRPFNRTLAGFLHAMQQVAVTDMTAPRCGSHHLVDFYRELARTPTPE